MHPNSFIHFAYSSKLAWLTDLDMFLVASMKSYIVMGTSSSDWSILAISVIEISPDANFFLMGIMAASRHTLATSAPEYPFSFLRRSA